ncbi:MAG TPA: ATP-binding protein [Candidatus Babeliales bacterium]|nr:ATP-binding protein [Candidatus Babeliales bacterium]
MILKRDLTSTLKRFAKFPVVGLFGPRQSGKTTLSRNTFPKHKYLNFEDPEIRDHAMRDPRDFLKIYENSHGIILDEFQYVPQILSYIQLESDEKKRPGYFVLTGSQNFLMNQAITQSLAGRIGILTLLPLSIHELSENKLLSENVNELIFRGNYPRPYTENFTPEEFYPSYIHSYVERDIRQLINVDNLLTFRKFMQLCAARTGQLLNISDLAVNCSITQKTAEKWLSILEASYIIYLLAPHYENFNKRATKTPKIYFYDTGLVCSLLGIKSAAEFSLSTIRGHLFECLIITDLYKQFYNAGRAPRLYFWRDKNGYVEIDCIVNFGSKLIPIEIKASVTARADLFDSLDKWNSLAQTDPANGYLVYGGDEHQARKNGTLINWQAAAELINAIYAKTNL